MAQKLSKDLPETFDTMDILWEDESTVEETWDVNLDDFISTDDMGILPDSEEDEETTEETTEEETTEDKTDEEKVDETTEVWSEDSTMSDAIGDNTEIKEGIDDAAKAAEEMKWTIEDVKEAIEKEDTDTVEVLIDELYKQVIDYSAKNDALSMKNDVLQEKLIELSKQNSNYELELAQTTTKSSDPKMLILNRMYDQAMSGEEFSKNKVITTLEDMYYSLTGKTFEEKRIDEVSDNNVDGVVLNEMTEPTIEEETDSTVDSNDITSIF